MTGTWSGWIASRPRKPRRRDARHAAASPAASRKSVWTVSIGGAAAAAHRHSDAAHSYSGEYAPPSSRLDTAPTAVERSSAPQVSAQSRAIGAPKPCIASIACGVSVATGTMRTLPASIPARASSASSPWPSRTTSAALCVLGSITPARPGTTTAARSAIASSESSGLMRTKSAPGGAAACAAMNSAAHARAPGLRAAATESSRSRISTSAPLDSALASLRSLSAGTNSSERSFSALTGLPSGPCGTTSPRDVEHGLRAAGRRRSRRLPQHQRLAGAGADLVAVLVETLVPEGDDAGVRARGARADFLDRRARADRVAVEHRFRETHVGHPEVGDRRAERRVVHRQPDHEAEREDAVDQRPAELGRAAVLGIEVDRRRVGGDAAEPDVVRSEEHTSELQSPLNLVCR